jgi:hypothetical protein
MTVSAPASTATRSFSSSSAVDSRSAELPMFAFTFTVRPAPTAHGFIRPCTRDSRRTTVPFAMPLRMLSTSTPSADAAAAMDGVVLPARAVSIIVAAMRTSHGGSGRLAACWKSAHCSLRRYYPDQVQWV